MRNIKKIAANKKHIHVFIYQVDQFAIIGVTIDNLHIVLKTISINGYRRVIVFFFFCALAFSVMMANKLDTFSDVRP